MGNRNMRRSVNNFRILQPRNLKYKAKLRAGKDIEEQAQQRFPLAKDKRQRSFFQNISSEPAAYKKLGRVKIFVL